MYAKTLFHKLWYVSDILGQSYKNICLTKWDETSENLETLKEVHYGKHYLWIRQIPLKNKNGIILPGHHRGQGTGKKPDPEICGYERTEPQGKE